MLAIRLLGQFDVRLDGQPVDIPSRPAQSLLAYLALKRAAPQRRERLAGLLWPEATEANARGYLRQALWRVRKALQPGGRDYIVADHLSLTFALGPEDWLDVAELEREASADELMRAVSVYAGELLPGFYDEWIAPERTRLQALFENKINLLLEHLLAERRWPEVLPWGERWIALGDVPEPAYRALMTAHWHLGGGAGLAAIFQRCVEALRRELGVEPSEPTRALYTRLSQEEPPVVSSTAPKASAPRGNLPRPLTSFIGREREIAQVTQRLATSPAQLITLTGPGGCGKTRLSLQVGHALQAEHPSRYPHGIWFVELAPLSDPALVPQTVAAALELRAERGRSALAALIDHLRAKKCLLILDNCEHVVEACAHLAEALLHACADLGLLATSREALGVPGEVTFQVPPLETPEVNQRPPVDALAHYEAVRLFVERAGAITPGFQLTPENAPAIAHICRRLDGMPLAIELAAARLNLLRVEQIAARLTDRFRLLTGGSRIALPRHQTLRALIDWSYDLLTEPERALLRRLSVFTNGWTLEAAEHVASDSSGVLAAEDLLDLLAQLVNKSLVVVEGEPRAEARYRLLETIRQYAREKLVAAEGGHAVRRRHLAYYLQLAEQAEVALAGPDQVTWLNRLEVELDNVRTALEWSLESEVEAGLRLASALMRFWEAHGRTHEGTNWLSQLLHQPEADAHLEAKAKALSAQSALLVDHGAFAQAVSGAEASLALFRAQGNRQGEAFALMLLGQVSFLQGDVVAAGPLLEQSLALYRAIGDKLGQAEVLSWLSLDRRDHDRPRVLLEESLALNRELGHLAGIASNLVSLAQLDYWRNEFSTAPQWLEEALALQRQLGSKSGMAWVLENFGNLAFRQGDYARARDYYEECIVLSESIGQTINGLWARANLAHIALREGQVMPARAALAECLQRFQDLQINIGVLYTVEGLASLAARQGQAARAVRLFAWADGERERIGDPRPPVEQASVDDDLTRARAQLDEAACVASQAEGRAMTRAQAITYAME